MQACATRAVLTRLGPDVARAALPVVTLVGFAALRAAPTLAVIVGFQVARRAVDYGVTRPARELLFTVGAANEKYEAKSFGTRSSTAVETLRRRASFRHSRPRSDPRCSSCRRRCA